MNSAIGNPRPSTVILACPKCGELGESDALEVNLICPECAAAWTKEPLRTADETIAVVRGLLQLAADASRQSFYDPQNVLRAINTAIDAYPDPPLPLIGEVKYSLRLSWGATRSGFPVSASGWHETAPRVRWVGSLGDAMLIARANYPAWKGTAVDIVVANQEELSK